MSPGERVVPQGSRTSSHGPPTPVLLFPLVCSSLAVLAGLQGGYTYMASRGENRVE